MSNIVSPLRWAGGKTWLWRHLKTNHIFNIDDYKNYHEPFLGGGAIFINVIPNYRVYLNDKNAELINFYSQVKDNIEVLISFLKTYESKNNKEDYYNIRAQKLNDPIKSAARFFYLNKTSFNGLYRVNLNGDYNVPYGFKEYKSEIFNYDKLRLLSKKLSKAKLTSLDFDKCNKNINKGDFVYIDPPYTVAHQNNGFIKYNEKLFSWEDQIRLSKFIQSIKKKDAYYILSQAADTSILELFGNIDTVIELDRSSQISGKLKGRRKIREYMFTNILQ